MNIYIPTSKLVYFSLNKIALSLWIYCNEFWWMCSTWTLWVRKYKCTFFPFFGSNIKSIKKLLIGKWFNLSVQLFNLRYVNWFGLMFGFMEFSAISTVFHDIGVPGETHRPAASRWHTLSHNVVPMENIWNKKSIYCKISEINATSLSQN